jgi:hypothetical protein
MTEAGQLLIEILNRLHVIPIEVLARAQRGSDLDDFARVLAGNEESQRVPIRRRRQGLVAEVAARGLRFPRISWISDVDTSAELTLHRQPVLRRQVGEAHLRPRADMLDDFGRGERAELG